MAKKGNKPNAVGRPWFDGKDPDEVLSKLRSSWDFGCSDAEAAMHANISTASLSRFLSVHEELRNERDQRKEKPVMLARSVIYQDLLKGSSDTAKWYLEKKRKDEFSSKTENVNTNINLETNQNIVDLLMNIPLKKKKHEDTTRGSNRRKV